MQWIGLTQVVHWRLTNVAANLHAVKATDRYFRWGSLCLRMPKKKVKARVFVHSICHMCVYNHVNTYAPLLNKKSEFPPHHLSLVFALHQFHRTMAPWQGDAKSAQFAKRVNTGKLSTVPCTYNRSDLASPCFAVWHCHLFTISTSVHVLPWPHSHTPSNMPGVLQVQERS